MSIQVDEKDKFFRDMKIIKKDNEGLGIVTNHVLSMKTRDEELRKIVLSHPWIVFETEAPDNIILYYLLKAKQINILAISLDGFVKNVTPISTIRNFRRKIIIDLQKQNIFLENEMKLRNKDAYVKGKYLKDEE